MKSKNIFQVLLLTLLILCVAHLGVAQTPQPPSVWDVSGAGNSTIQGFAAEFSVNLGETIHFKVNTTASAYRFDIYRLGYYGGNGAALIATVNPSVTLPQTQPACKTDAATRLYDCGNWANSGQWAVPLNAKSGIYFAKITRTDNNAASHIYFIVRNDASTSDILFQASDTTWYAYNQFGGNSVYGANGSNSFSNALRAYKVSYNRPIDTRGWNAWSFLFNAEYPMIRFLEANGYDVSYIAGRDVDQRGSLLLNHKIYLSTGHDEYWPATQRANVEAARDAGVNLAFYSGNEVFWKVRWENSIDGSNTPYRTMVCYKETHANAKIDPTATWTGTWRDPRFSPPSDGGKPENSLTGTLFAVNDINPGETITVPDTDGKMRFWRNTNIATLASGASTQLSGQTLGVEWDEDTDNGFRPAGAFRLSTTTYNVPYYLLDYGSTYGPGTAVHHMMLYRAASGALVFGSGTMQLAWALDSNHDNVSSPNPAVDQRMQQATINLFADMGVQPTTLMAGLVAATKSTDTFAPTSTITFPLAGAVISAGTAVTITGTAADTGGGVVAGVEVSVDNGATWHVANGRSSWTYSWVSGGTTAIIKSRAVDDSANLQTTPASVTVNAGGGGAGGKTLGYTTIGSQADSGDSNYIDAVRFTMPNETGTAKSMSVYIMGPAGAAPNNQYSMAIYANSGSAPGALIASTATGTVTPNAWNTIPIAANLSPNTTYWLAYNTNGNSVTYNNMKFDAGAAGQLAWRAQAFGTWPTTFGSATGSSPAMFSIYVLYDTAGDTTNPSATTGLTANGSFGTASLSWTAATDNVGVVKYDVYRSTTSGFTPSVANRVAQPIGTTYNDTGLAAGTYYYLVAAEDAAGNIGTASNQASAIVTSDTQAPSNPSNLAALVSGTTASLAWTGSTDNVAVTKYDVYRSTTNGFAPSVANRIAQPTTTSYSDAGLAVGTYYYLVAAEDAVGNISTSSNQTTAVIPDTAAPTTPASLAAVVTTSSVSLSWTASTDNIGVTKYDVYRSTTSGFVPSAANLIAQPTTNSYVNSGVADATYYYVVKAEDLAGNLSGASNQATAIVDTTLPSVPSNLLAVAASGSSINLTWGASTDTGSGVAGYRIYRGAAANSLVQVGTSTVASFTDTGLTSNTTYYYAVAAVDGANNLSTQAGPVSATTSALATFQLGTTAVGTISDDGYANTMSAFRYQTGAAQSGAVSSITVYLPAPIGASPNNLFQVAIYADAAGVPGALIASSASQTITAVGWKSVPITATLAANTAYWLVYNTNAAVAANNSLILSPGGTYKWKSQTFGTWPATFGTTQGSSTNTASIYATVN